MANEAEPGRCSWLLLPALLQGPQTLRDSLRVSSGLLLIYSFLGFLVGTKSTIPDLFLDIPSHLQLPRTLPSLWVALFLSPCTAGPQNFPQALAPSQPRALESSFKQLTLSVPLRA